MSYSVGTIDGIILNASAYTHTSVLEMRSKQRHQLLRCIFQYIFPKVFVTSFITNAKGLILGFGLDVYRLAIEAFAEILNRTVPICRAKGFMHNQSDSLSGK